MICAIFHPSNDVQRMTGYARKEYSSSDSDETVIEITEDTLTDVFENVDVATLAGTDVPTEDAVDDPLQYRDYLILEEGEIVFDEDYERSNEKSL